MTYAELIGSEYDHLPAPNWKKAAHIAFSGLHFDGAHHKQWFLEEILKAIGCDLAALKAADQADGYDWDEGIPP